MTRVILLGTGTGVGKTYVTAALARALHAARPTAPLLAMKPLETGVTPLSSTSDHALLAQVCHHVPPVPPLCSLAEPVSPHLALRHAGVNLSPGDLLAHVLNSAPHSQHALCLIETAGGAFSPLLHGFTNADFALRLDPAFLVLVAPDSLGVLHDLTATLTALRATTRQPDAVVLSRSRPDDPSTGTNAAELTRLGVWHNPHLLPDPREPPLAALVEAVLALNP